jgi:hypothetical protein
VSASADGTRLVLHSLSAPRGDVNADSLQRPFLGKIDRGGCDKSGSSRASKWRFESPSTEHAVGVRGVVAGTWIHPIARSSGLLRGQ